VSENTGAIGGGGVERENRRGACLPHDALDELVHGEGDVRADGEHLPQRVFVLRRLHVAIQQITNHLQEGRVVILHLDVHWGDASTTNRRRVNPSSLGERRSFWRESYIFNKPEGFSGSIFRNYLDRHPLLVLFIHFFCKLFYLLREQERGPEVQRRCFAVSSMGKQKKTIKTIQRVYI